MSRMPNDPRDNVAALRRLDGGCFEAFPVPGAGYGRIACTICGDTEPFHVHVNGGRMEDYFTIGRGMSDLAAARAWKDRALAAERALAAKEGSGNG